MKTLQILCIMAIALSSISMQGQSGLRPPGDVNCDWEVNIADVNTLVDSILHGAQYDPFYSYATDVNHDKEINIADISLLIHALQGEALPPMPSYSGTLPVLYINTEGHHDINSKEEYIHADWWLDAMGIEGVQPLGTPDEPLGMLIKGRGNYSWTLDKKSFRIKLDTKEHLLGMKSNRHFCLLAHADDHYAKLKNTVGFELSRRIGMPYTPAQQPVEVVLNGQYIGLYFLTEKIRVDKDRVNIEEQKEGETDAHKLTGGWLLEIDNNTHDKTIYLHEHEQGDKWYDWMWITSHSPEEMSPQQRHYIQHLLESINSAIYETDKTSTEWEQYIDIDSLACFYIIGEIMDDIEYFSGSCYMYKHLGDSTKLIFGPVWDFGNSFLRNDFYPDLADYNYFIYQQPCFFYNHWIEEIAKFPNFQAAVKRHWREFYDSGFNGLDIDQFIDCHVRSIRQAWYRNAARWSGNSIEWEADIFKQRLLSKIAWLNSQWSD